MEHQYCNVSDVLSLRRLLLHSVLFLPGGAAGVLRGLRVGPQHVLRQAEAVVLHEQGGAGREEPVAAVQTVPAQREQAGAGGRLLDPILQLSNLRQSNMSPVCFCV